jgi:Family of unknown function (DUF695)
MGATSLGQLGIMENKNEEKDWSVLQGTLDHKPIFTSFRLSVNTKENYRQYPYQIGVAVPLLNPTVHGLPTNDEATQLWAIIDELKSKLETDYKSLCYVPYYRRYAGICFLYFGMETKRNRKGCEGN